MNITPGMDLIVIKRNIAGEETWRYNGKVVDIQPSTITLEAFFNRPDYPFHGIVLGQGDRFIETYFTDRWYNIFEIHAREDDHLKGWYCNICLPAELGSDTLSYVDLALDLLVFPNGMQLVLDEDEFAALNIPPQMQTQAWQALFSLQDYFQDEVPASSVRNSDQ
jgi:hypothetical protein